ncbi:hypothetical protein M2161_008998 [Streptomyces sp. SAI-133]|nr:hypothetical protein [Streptomyces sp. SAI-133]
MASVIYTVRFRRLASCRPRCPPLDLAIPSRKPPPSRRGLPATTPSATALATGRRTRQHGSTVVGSLFCGSGAERFAYRQIALARSGREDGHESEWNIEPTPQG